jgi:hypothetical protein
LVAKREGQVESPKEPDRIALLIAKGKRHLEAVGGDLASLTPGGDDWGRRKMRGTRWGGSDTSVQCGYRYSRVAKQKRIGASPNQQEISSKFSGVAKTRRSSFSPRSQETTSKFQFTPCKTGACTPRFSQPNCRCQKQSTRSCYFWGYNQTEVDT